MLRVLLLTLALAAPGSHAVCDGNPHAWPRARRCDQFDPRCPDVSWTNCSLCEGIGGIASKDTNTGDSFKPTTCKPLATPDQLKAQGQSPVKPLFPTQFVNSGFHEVQIFVKHDPFCLAQIPAMVSNGTHCFKKQEGVFNYDATAVSLRIDYDRSETPFGFNMTEHFYHLPDGTVHPDITKYGRVPTPACPCIKLGVGPVSPGWALDAEYLGREELGVEFITQANGTRGTGGGNDGINTWVVDHFVKGPHHVWVDVASKQIIRLWQPFNGLEVFDPAKWQVGAGVIPPGAFKLPTQCALEAKLGCINGEGPTAAAAATAAGISLAARMATHL